MSDRTIKESDIRIQAEQVDFSQFRDLPHAWKTFSERSRLRDLPAPIAHLIRAAFAAGATVSAELLGRAIDTENESAFRQLYDDAAALTDVVRRGAEEYNAEQEQKAKAA